MELGTAHPEDLGQTVIQLAEKLGLHETVLTRWFQRVRRHDKLAPWRHEDLALSLI